MTMNRPPVEVEDPIYVIGYWNLTEDLKTKQRLAQKIFDSEQSMNLGLSRSDIYNCIRNRYSNIGDEVIKFLSIQPEAPVKGITFLDGEYEQ